MYRCIVFDIDGTLINTENTFLYSLHDTILCLMEEDRPLESLREYFSLPSSKVGGLLGYHDEKEFLQVWNCKWEEYRHMMGFFPGMEGAILKARSLGYRIGCVTSRSAGEFYEDKHIAPYIDCFDALVLSGDTQAHKPSPEPMYLLIERISQKVGENIPLSEVLYVGDSPADYGCSRASGCSFALVDWNHRGNQGMDPDYLIQEPGQLMQILEENTR